MVCVGVGKSLGVICRYGMKGKVDVTVRSNQSQSAIPLELKTGRASYSAEHIGQVSMIKDCSLNQQHASRC